MESMQTIYLGDLRTESVHLKSGSTLITDAPPDNQGKGEAFSPTDLLCVSLATCMSTLMGISARNHNLDIAGMKMRIVKKMHSNPRRVGEIEIHIDMPHAAFNEKEKILLEHAARTCPVALSIHPELLQIIHFQYPLL